MSPSCTARARLDDAPRQRAVCQVRHGAGTRAACSGEPRPARASFRVGKQTGVRPSSTDRQALQHPRNARCCVVEASRRRSRRKAARGAAPTHRLDGTGPSAHRRGPARATRRAPPVSAAPSGQASSTHVAAAMEGVSLRPGGSGGLLSAFSLGSRPKMSAAGSKEEKGYDEVIKYDRAVLLAFKEVRHASRLLLTDRLLLTKIRLFCSAAPPCRPSWSTQAPSCSWAAATTSS